MKLKILFLVFIMCVNMTCLPVYATDETSSANAPDHITVAQRRTNIVGDIAAIIELNSADLLDSFLSMEFKPAIMILTINDKLEVLNSDMNVISTVDDFFNKTNYRIIPAFRIEDKASCDALCTYLNGIGFNDCIMLSSDPSLVKKAREVVPQASGAIDYTDIYKDMAELTEDQCLDIRRSVKSNNASIAVLPADICISASVQYLFNRQVNVWAALDDGASKKEQYSAILSGAVGVISNDIESILDIAINQLPQNTMTRTPLAIGHRGIPSMAPENTLEGAIMAYEMGANVIELDLYLTTDGEAVVMHDGTTGRTCNVDLAVEGSSLEQLKQLYANRGFEDKTRFKECRIPTFREFLEYFKDTDCQLFVEIKTSNTAIVKVIKEQIEEYDMYGSCSVITFNENIMAAMKAEYPEMSVGALCDRYMTGSDPEAELRNAMSYIGKYNATLNPYYDGYFDNDNRAAMLRGISVYPWTFIGDIGQHKNYIFWGYAGLTTNNVNIFKDISKGVECSPDSTTVEVGSTEKLSLNLHRYNRKIRDRSPSLVTVLSGQEYVTISDTNEEITFNEIGEVTLILGYEVNIGGDVATFIAQPVTFTSVEKLLPDETEAISTTDAEATETVDVSGGGTAENNNALIYTAVSAVIVIAVSGVVIASRKKKS